MPSHFLTRCFLLTLALAFLLAPQLYAQDSQQAQINTQQDLMNREGATEPEQGVPCRLGDSELGEVDVVSRAPRPKMFTFSTFQTFNYTTNAFLAQDGERDAFFWNGRLDASFVPYATRDFTPRLTFEQNFFRYTRFSRLDFDSQSLQLDIKYDLNRNDTWYLDGSYAINRLYTPRGSAGEFYRYGLASITLNHVQPLGHLPLYAFYTLGTYSRHGDPSTFDRVAPYLSGALIYRPLDPLQVSVFVRPEGQFYTNDPNDSSRRDFNLSVGSAVTWSPNEYVSVGATLTFVGNYSTAAGQSYDVFSPSIGLSARIAF